jgi:hypothetical protein
MKWEMVMTHTARRSFCTNMYLKGIPVPTIMAISGHKTEKNFYKYIKADGMEHAKMMKRMLANPISEPTETVLFLRRLNPLFSAIYSAIK